MTIQELADRAGVTTRTIRYYVEQGVLPPPGRGRPSEYTGEHLRLLDAIRRLKEQYLPLEEIRDVLQRLTPQQLEEFLGRTASPPPAQEGPDSAVDYISRVLNRGAMRSQFKEQAPAPPGAPSMPPVAQPAANPPAPTPAPPLRRESGTVPLEAGNSPLYDTRAVPAAGLGTGTKSESAGYRQSSPGEERTWQRVTLAPGVELHYEADVPGSAGDAIRRIVEAARAILGFDPEKGTKGPK
ncbi:MAG TPA: MerR family transcriptional regulator [Chloroflexia bacterium]|jgi:DNA-binding transcriptional MerR regulator